MKIKTVISMSVLALFFANCKDMQDKKNTDQTQSQAVVHTDGTIDYTSAKGYFVLNTVDNKQVESLKITTQSEFDTYFGAAATMGENGKPTAIDFEKQYVIALIGQTTNKDTDFEIISLKDKGQFIEFIFKVDCGKQELSYTIHPYALLVVDNSYDKDIRFIAE